MMHRMLVIFLIAGFARGQDSKRLTFDVTSIKPSTPGGRGGGIKPLPGGQEYRAQGAPVKQMISLMYRISLNQISGGPDWLNTDLWDIEAKADHSYNLDDLHTMFQNLLADEFKLKFHKQVKEGPVYVLSVDKGGERMKVNDSPQDFEIPIQGGPRMGVTFGKRVPMPYMAYWLGLILRDDQRPVIDRTGLDKNYDFKLEFLPPLPPGFNKENLPPELLEKPSIFEALKQQLGLKLDAQRGPIEYYVIDSVEKPASN